MKLRKVILSNPLLRKDKIYFDKYNLLTYFSLFFCFQCWCGSIFPLVGYRVPRKGLRQSNLDSNTDFMLINYYSFIYFIFILSGGVVLEICCAQPSFDLTMVN